VSRGPHFSQKGKVKAKKISPRWPDVARGPYVAPSCYSPHAFLFNDYIAAWRHKTFHPSKGLTAFIDEPKEIYFCK